MGNGRYTNDRIVISKSVGAKARDQFVLLPDGTKGKLKEGSSITKIVTFAGKCTSKEIKVAKFLAEQYNVDVNEWKKVRGDGYVICDDSKIKHSELHWFESEKTGRIQMKVKYIGKSDPCCLINGKKYECLGEEYGEFRVIDEEGTDEDEELQGYLYPKRFFEIIEP